MKPRTEMVNYDTLVGIFERVKATPQDATSVEETGIAAIDRAIKNLGNVEQLHYLMFDLIALRCAVGTLDQEQIDKQVKADRAAKLLREAGAILKEIGSPCLTDLCNDLAAGAELAAGGPSFMQYIGPHNPKPGKDYEKTRLYPHRWGCPNIVIQRTKTAGRAASNPDSAASGAAVRTMANHFDDQIPERAAIIADLCCIAGYPVISPTVTKILAGYTPKEAPAQDVDWYTVIKAKR
ncbi:MAG: hypothetical protein GJU72_05485 [Acidithiobacillus ferriphilus]|jgi:hypothetical protein|uniref:hypothetical protein n=1 Tax=Acidithiobacillus ferriphilus TaxID=1689834 RepID=UPI002430D823|nr:hypothetical protein [Acidithiobacillus ferriphilus]MBW9248524.1 hypothetical protein [Acidithiobacillus ferriphilus]MBW9253645.1 hypothetical protein [Acidithiobacillus ferriphilus]